MNFPFFKTKPLGPPFPDWIGPAICGTWAFFICRASGFRGFFAMDQSIVFDGGWRILQGQIPFVDFFLPHGPLSMWIQALAFALFGVSYRIYVLTAASMNAVGALLAYGTFRTLVPEKKWPALTAGLLTGSWFYAPMGTAYIEQTGFFFLWVAIFAVVRGLAAGSLRSLWMSVGGLALAAAILAKTNTGMLAAPFLFLMPVLLRQNSAKGIFRDWIALGAGLALGLAAFYFWLASRSDPAAFHRHVLEIAGQEGRKRILENKEIYFVVCSLFNGKGNDLVRLLTVGAYTLMGLGVIWALGPGKRRPVERLRRLGFLGLLWIAYQQLFGVTSNNNGINEQPFLGLIFVCAALVAEKMAADLSSSPQRLAFLRRVMVGGLGLALLFTVCFYVLGIRGMGNFDFILGVALALGFLVLASHPKANRPLGHRILVATTVVSLGTLFLIGSWGSYFRQAQDFFNFHTRYVMRPDIPALRGLAWAEGVNDDARTMHPTWTELVETWRILREAPGRFYLLGNYTILYAATGKPSLGILSWFFKGLTYSKEYDPEFDRRFAALVDQPDVTYFVTEEDFGLKYKLQDFPRLARVLTEKYRSEKKVGLFHLYRRIPSGQASASGGYPAKGTPPMLPRKGEADATL